jgi:hypothetical protein
VRTSVVGTYGQLPEPGLVEMADSLAEWIYFIHPSGTDSPPA